MLVPTLLAQASDAAGGPISAFLAHGLMDVVRSALLIVLVAWVWILRAPGLGIRPFHDFLVWGVRYPFLLAFFLLLTALVWGLVGGDYGFRAMFLGDDLLLQFELGVMVSMMTLGISYHFFTLDTSGSGWRKSLDLTVEVMRWCNRIAAGLGWEWRSQKGLSNGFLEILDDRDLDLLATAIDEASSRNTEGPMGERWWNDVFGHARTPAVRILFSPATTAVSSLMLILLLGVVPVVQGWIERRPLGWIQYLPWGIGQFIGSCVAIFVSRHLSRTFAIAIGADPAGEAERLRSYLRKCPEGVRGPAPVPPLSRPERGIIAFGFVHIGVCLCFWLVDRPWKAAFSTRAGQAGLGGPLPYLVAELAAAFLLLKAWDRGWIAGPLRALGKAAVAAASPAIGVVRWMQRRGNAAAWALLVVVALPVRWWLLNAEPASLRGDAMNTALLSAYLVFWGICCSVFLVANEYRGANPSRHFRVRCGAALAMIAAGVLAWTTGEEGRPWPYTAAALLGAGAYACVCWGFWRRSSWAWLVGLSAALATLLSAPWRQLDAFRSSIWLIQAILTTGSASLVRLRDSKQPALVFPWLSLVAFAGFAMLYSGADLDWRRSVPAGASIVVLLGMSATLYLVAKFSHPKRSALILSLMAVGLFAVNGNAWKVSPNHFKYQFPGLEAYYLREPVGLPAEEGGQRDRRNPTLLDSRAYFRATTGNVLKLRDATGIRSDDGKAGLDQSERLASLTFEIATPIPPPPTPPGLMIRVNDLRHQFRVASGDPVGLYLPELSFAVTPCKGGRGWTIRLERDDSRQPGAAAQEAVLPLADEIRVRLEDPDGVEVDGAPPVLRFRKQGAEARGLVKGTGDFHGEFAHSPGTREIVFTLTRPAGRTPDWLHLSGIFRGTVQAPVPGLALIDGKQRAIRPNERDIHFPKLPNTRGADVKLLDNSHLVFEAERKEVWPGSLDALWPAFPENEALDLLHLAAPHEMPIVLGTFAAPVSGEGHRPIREALAARFPEGIPAGSRFFLRPSRGRGIFAEPRSTEGLPGSLIASTREGLLREGDRVVVRQPSESGPDDFTPATVVMVKGGREVTLREGVSDRAEPAAPSLGKRPAAGWELARPLNNVEVLEAWKRQMDRLCPPGAGPSDPGQGRAPKRRLPPLVIVTVSGGGIRASVWTATVLNSLRETLGTSFPYHIRLVTGASGGMVSASYFVMGLEHPSRMGQWVNLDALQGDQLNAVAGALVFNDIPGLLNPLQRATDRGRVLEDVWAAQTGAAGESPLARPLRDYLADERAGWRPSMVYTPMMVEDGRRLLISNLDLGFLSRNYGRLIEGETSSRLDPTYFDQLSGGSLTNQDELFSLSALEFSRLFPSAWDFKVSTAVRMSASFPWVCPAVSLPTIQTRRVVDAGYYDNYGVNLASQWLTKLRHWLLENTSGVIVIQIRDHISQKARTQLEFDRPLDGEEADEPFLSLLTLRAGRDLLGPGFYPLGTPLTGIASAQQWSMSFRNDEQLELFDRLLVREGTRRKGNSDFFRTVVFECPVQASLSWTLSEDEKRRIHLGMVPLPTEFEIPSTEIEAIEAGNDKKKAEKTYKAGLQCVDPWGAFDSLSYLESKQLYENLINNQRRLRLLRDWWRRHAPDCPKP